MSVDHPTTSTPVEHREHSDFPGYQVGSDGGVWQPAVEYRDIPSFPGYQVGSDGTFWTRHVPGHSCLGPTWRPMKPIVQKRNGYLHVTLRRDGKPYQFRAHRIVLEVFVGPCPPGMEACHFPDRSPGNIRLDNLRWGTKQDNCEDRRVHGTNCDGSRVGTSKLTETDIKQIALLLAECVSHAEIARQFNVNKSTIGKIAAGQGWKSEADTLLSAMGSFHVPVDRKAGLTPKDIAAIRRLLSNGLSQTEIARQFGVDSTMISLIARGKAWAHVEEGKDLPIPTFKAMGSQKGNAKLTESDIPEIRRMIAEGVPATDIAVRYGIGVRAIQYIKQGKSWSHVPV